MSNWIPVPEPVTWPLLKPVDFNNVRYAGITLRAPLSEEVLKAASTPGASGLDITHRLIAEVSGVPWEIVKKLPHWQIEQMSDYFDLFAGMPEPDPLVAWRAAQRAAAEAPASAPAENPAAS